MKVFGEDGVVEVEVVVGCEVVVGVVVDDDDTTAEEELVEEEIKGVEDVLCEVLETLELLVTGVVEVELILVAA